MRMHGLPPKWSWRFESGSLGCIEPAGTYGGGSTVGVVTLTSLGRAFVEAAINVPAR